MDLTSMFVAPATEHKDYKAHYNRMRLAERDALLDELRAQVEQLRTEVAVLKEQLNNARPPRNQVWMQWE